MKITAKMQKLIERAEKAEADCAKWLLKFAKEREEHSHANAIIESQKKSWGEAVAERDALKANAERYLWIKRMWPLEITRLVHSHHASGPTSTELDAAKMQRV